MGCDMLTALGPATSAGRPLFGVNCFGPAAARLRLTALPRRIHCADEVLMLSGLSLPQVRQTCAALGLQNGASWGFVNGVNEHGVALGCSRWRSRLAQVASGLTATEAVRLSLERSHTARHAVEVLSDLVGRLGLSGGGAEPSDAIFLVADRGEAYVLEAAGAFWALSECQHVRAVADAALIRQDWLRLAPGFAEHVLQQGWWPDNGTKLDFAGVLGPRGAAPGGELRRWGKATLLLAQHNGSLDVPRLRRLLPEHFAACERHSPAAAARQLAASWLAELDDAPVVAWHRVGGAESDLYFPLVVDAELPEEWTEATLRAPRQMSAEDCARLQAQFDADVQEYRAEAGRLRARGEETPLRRLAQVLMQKHVEQWHEECYQLSGRGVPAPPRTPARPRPQEEEAVTYSFG
jgi:hypothetical protein